MPIINSNGLKKNVRPLSLERMEKKIAAKKTPKPDYKRFLAGHPPCGEGFSFVSLFSGAGIGDFGFTLAGAKCLGASEIDPHRRAVHERNIGANVWGDICLASDEIISFFDGANLDVLVATPPCQSFSSANSHRGRMSNPIHAKKDERNRLFFEALRIASKIKPKVVVFENVPNFLDRVIECETVPGHYCRVSEHIGKALYDYAGVSKILCFSGIGVPQRRKRSVSLFIRKDLVASTSEVSDLLDIARWGGRFSRVPKTIKSALRCMGSLDGEEGGGRASSVVDDLHSVPTYTPRHYNWISSIPKMSGLSAWQNDCASCGGSNTPWGELSCVVCGGFMANRPHVVKENGVEPIRGFKTSYRRIKPNELSPTITTASGHFSSDLKIHFSENRVLSPRECALIQTIPYSFVWPKEQKFRRRYLLREMIGEAVPPLFMYMLGIALSKFLGKDNVGSKT